MRMKKRIVSLALAAVVMASVSMPALATSKFNMGVFDGRQDVTITSDEMTGEIHVAPSADSYDSEITFDNGSRLTVVPILILNDNYDSYQLWFNCLEIIPTDMTSIIIKIGDNRYSFSNCYTTHYAINDDFSLEQIGFLMKRETVDFMNDFAKHRDEEIKVRINGNCQTLDFSLTDEMKNEILTTYALYVQGGGTRDKNLRDLTDIDTTIVCKNGKAVDGHIKEELIDSFFNALR